MIPKKILLIGYTLAILMIFSALNIAAKPAKAQTLSSHSNLNKLFAEKLVKKWTPILGSSSYKAYTKDLTSVKSSQPTSLDTSFKGKKVLGFATYYYSNDKSSYNSMINNSSLLNEIATETFETDAYGNLSGSIPFEQIDFANKNNITTMAMITNNFNGSTAKNLLESSENRQNLINNILASLNANGYKGVNIDLEGLYYYDRIYMTTFMRDLYNTLNPKGYIVTIDIPAKVYDNPKDGWSGAFDYTELSKYADEIAIMTYDEHYIGGTPGPIASIGWVENVVKYAITIIPKEKLLLGIAVYGYDWSSNGTKGYSIDSMYKIASQNNASINWDIVSKSPYFNYTDSLTITHDAWFEDSTSIGYKLDLVNEYNLSGIAIWRLGLENSDFWTTVKNKLNK